MRPLLQCLPIVVALLAAAAQASNDGEDDVAKEPRRAFVKVEYADTLQGIQAMFAVRACATEDRPLTRTVVDGAAASSPPGVDFVHESMTPTADDIVVHVIDSDGREIAKHVGVADVCGFSRIAAAFVVQGRDSQKGIDK